MNSVRELFRHSWQFLLAACVLLFIACAQIPVSNQQTDTKAESVPETTAAAESLASIQPDRVSSESNQNLSVNPEPQSAVNPVSNPEAPPQIAVLENAETLASSGSSGIQAPIPDSPAPDSESLVQTPSEQPAAVVELCKQIGEKLGSVSVTDCHKQGFLNGGGHSVNGRPLVIKEILPLSPQAQDFRVLIMGGIHGDEYASISILFKWLDLYSEQGVESEFKWRFAPLVNPDGLLDGQAKRQNANGVDLNRNFPSQDWNASAVEYWQQSTGSNPRRFPGSNAASEPEVQWLVAQIEEFQPDVIVSLHAPYHQLDFDGPSDAPEKIGELYFHQLGVYPGSLGNYAGLNKRIPVITLELPSAGIMPPPEQISLMWKDLVAWLDREGRKGLTN